MGKTNELSLLLDELAETGSKLVEVASAIKELFSPVPDEPESKPAPTPKSQLTAAEVRTLLVEKSNMADGKYKPQVKALVQKYSGGASFSAIKPEQYEALVADLEAIGDA